MDEEGLRGGYCSASGCTEFDLLLHFCDFCSRPFCAIHTVTHDGCPGNPESLSRVTTAPTTVERSRCVMCDDDHDATAIIVCSGCGQTVCLKHRYLSDHKCKSQTLPTRAGDDTSTLTQLPGSSRLNRLALGNVGSSRDAALSPSFVIAAFVTTLEEVDAGRTIFLVVNPLWPLGKIVDTLLLFRQSASASRAATRPLCNVPVGGTSYTDYNAFVAVSDLSKMASVTPFVLGVSWSRTVAQVGEDVKEQHRLVMTEVVLFITLKNLTAEQVEATKGFQTIIRIARPATVVESKTAATTDVEGGVAEPPLEAAPRAPDSVKTFVASPALPSLLEVVFKAGKRNPFAAKEAGLQSSVVAIYFIERLPASAKATLTGACFRVSPVWPVGKLVDVVLNHLSPDTKDPQNMRTCNLKTLSWIPNATPCSSFANGDCLVVIRGDELPSTVVDEATRCQGDLSSPAVKLKMQKDCLVA